MKNKRLFWAVYVNFYKQKKQVIIETDKSTEILNQEVNYNHGMFKPLKDLEIIQIREICQ